MRDLRVAVIFDGDPKSVLAVAKEVQFIEAGERASGGEGTFAEVITTIHTDASRAAYTTLDKYISWGETTLEIFYDDIDEIIDELEMASRKAQRQRDFENAEFYNDDDIRPLNFDD